MKKCHQCNNEIAVSEHKSVKRKFCSHECYAKNKAVNTDALFASGLRRCSKCRNEKPVGQFSPKSKSSSPSESQRFHGWCKQCRSENEKERRVNPRIVLTHQTKYSSDMTYRARERLRAMAKRCRRKKFEFDLDEEWLVSRLSRGVCELTGLPFDLQVRRKWASPYAPSIDRIKAGSGYTKDNCRLVLFSINASMGDWGLDAFMPIAEALVLKFSNKANAA